jgi:hypothetical protein
MTKHPYAGAPTRKRKRLDKPKRKGGRPRRYRPSEESLNTMVRPWIGNALDDAPRPPPITILKDGVPTQLRQITKEEFLAMLRGRVDDFVIAEEAYRYLAAADKSDGVRRTRDDRIAWIARWLNRNPTTVTNWLNRSRRVR